MYCHTGSVSKTLLSLRVNVQFISLSKLHLNLTETETSSRHHTEETDVRGFSETVETHITNRPKKLIRAVDKTVLVKPEPVLQLSPVES